MRHSSKPLFVLFALFPFSTLITAQVVEWTLSLGGEGNTEWAADVIFDGQLTLACGVSNSSNGSFPNSQGQDIWLQIMNSDGTSLNSLKLGGSANEGAKCIIKTSDGGYILTGISFSTDGDALGANYHGNGDFWVVKLDALLNIQWQEMYGGSNRDDPQAIIETLDGHYLVAGYTASSDGDVTGFHTGSPVWNDAWILKLGPSGEIVWQKCIGGAHDEAAWSIVETPGGFVFAGHSQSSDGDMATNYGNRDLMVASLDKATGNLNWIKTYGGSEMDTGLDLIYSSRNTLAIAGHSGSDDFDVTNLNGMSEFWFLELDTFGNRIRSETYGSPGADVAHSIEELSANRYLLAGRAGTGGGAGGDVSQIYGGDAGTDAWILLVDSLGNKIAEKNYGGSQQDIFYSSALNSNGILMAAGQTRSDDFDLSDNQGGSDWFIARISYQDHILSALGHSPKEQYEMQVYPNPSAGTIHILPGDAAISHFELINSYGEVLQMLRPGQNSLSVDNGLYFIRAFTGNGKVFPSVEKLIIAR